MSETALTQYEADSLIKMDKIPVNDDLIELPDFGGVTEIFLQSRDKQEKFILNYRKRRIDILKRNYHFRGRKVIGLVRLCLDGKPHRNPDRQEVGPRHLHLYREGYDLKWASEIPTKDFPNLSKGYDTLLDFLKYLHVIKNPNLKKGLFS